MPYLDHPEGGAALTQKGFGNCFRLGRLALQIPPYFEVPKRSISKSCLPALVALMLLRVPPMVLLLPAAVAAAQVAV